MGEPGTWNARCIERDLVGCPSISPLISASPRLINFADGPFVSSLWRVKQPSRVHCMIVSFWLCCHGAERESVDIVGGGGMGR